MEMSESELKNLISRILKLDSNSLDELVDVQRVNISSWDSLAAFELYINISSVLHSEIDIENFMKLGTIRDLLELIKLGN